MAAAGAGALAFAPSAHAAAEDRPNVIFILADDLGWTDLGCYGSSFYETPAIDRLAASGMRFTDAYSASPVCSPTRASILTGKNPARLKVTNYIPGNIRREMIGAPYYKHLRHDETTLAEEFSGAGYRTFFAGKWHLGSEPFWPERQGFDHNKGGTDQGGPYSGKGYFSPYDNPRLKNGPEGEHLPDRLARETVSFIRQPDRRPFFAFLSFYSVHSPFMARSDLKAKYAARTVPGAWKHDGDVKNVRLVQNDATYAAMVEAMDTAVETVLSALTEDGLDDNTIVVFTSDNGGYANLPNGQKAPTSNLPLRAGKGWLYEGGVRVPTIIRWPGEIAAGSESSAPIISTDYYHTLLAAAGLQSDSAVHADGLSILPLLRGGGPPNRQALYWHYPHHAPHGSSPGGAIRVGSLKLVESYLDERLELYDLESDIGETTDISGEYPEKTRELARMLHTWRTDVGAEMPVLNPEWK